MRKENLVSTKTISVFDLSKVNIGNAYQYTHVTNEGTSVTFQGILLQKYEDYLVFAISNYSKYTVYSTFVDDTVAGGSIVRLPARFLGKDDTLEELTVRKQGRWETHEWDGEVTMACPFCPSIYDTDVFQKLTANGDKAPRYCSYCGAELWRDTDETD